MAAIKIIGEPAYIDALYSLLHNYREGAKQSGEFYDFVCLSPKDRLKERYAKYLVVGYGVNYLSFEDEKHYVRTSCIGPYHF